MAASSDSMANAARAAGGLVALGIVLIYKTSGTANFAQGAIAMMGAYVTWLFAARIGLPMWVAITAAMIVMFGFGMLIERTALRRMIGQPVIMVVMLTFGIELLLRGAVLTPNGKRRVAAEHSGPAIEAEAVGQKLAEMLLASGARELLMSPEVTPG